MNAFYAELEEGVREYVKILRDAGINTECSCHHEGYIQCQCVDPTWEIETIRRALWGKVHKYKISLIYEQTGKDAAHWYRTIDITSDDFKKKK